MGVPPHTPLPVYSANIPFVAMEHANGLLAQLRIYMYTTSSIFLKTVRDAGITHAFVNWGSDHPALLEDIQRQRIAGEANEFHVITCPNEMVALSAAHGYALVARKPAVVIVHVDVGTQALAGAVHNATRGRVPVLIYAGAAPSTIDGEVKGSRNEYMFWLQDIPDQPAIVRQYMRFTSQISCADDVSKMTMRALQMANSEPKGPAYLWARREVMEHEVDEALYNKSIDIRKWSSLGPVTLPPSAVKELTTLLLEKRHPLIVTSYLGRDPSAVEALVALSDMLAVPVLLSCPSVMCFPQNHPHFVGVTFGAGGNRFMEEADLILILDSDIPWINQKQRPRNDAKIFHIDVDALKNSMGMFHLEADASWSASIAHTLQAINIKLLDAKSQLDFDIIAKRRECLVANFTQQCERLTEVELSSTADGRLSIANLIAVLREACPPNTTFINESITNFPAVWAHLKPSRPGSIFSSGSSSLGFGLGGSIGASLATKEKTLREQSTENNFICLIVGDGSYMFGVPSTAYWMARRFKTPFLTIILNNGGWKAPKMSMLGIYPNGLGSQMSGQELTVSFGPDPPDYSSIATAAGGAWGFKVVNSSELRGSIEKAIETVRDQHKCAVLDCLLDTF